LVGPGKSFDRGVLSSRDDLITKGRAGGGEGEFSTIQENGDPELHLGVRGYLFYCPVVLGVPELNISIGPAASKQGAGCGGREGEGVDGRRHIVDKPAPVDFHGNREVVVKRGEENKRGGTMKARRRTDSKERRMQLANTTQRMYRGRCEWTE
jgi:hypothetical protein